MPVDSSVSFACGCVLSVSHCRTGAAEISSDNSVVRVVESYMNVVLFGHSRVEQFHVFTAAVTHPLANRESAAVPHAEVRALLMSGRSGFRPAFVFCGSGDCGSTDGEHR